MALARSPSKLGTEPRRNPSLPPPQVLLLQYHIALNHLRPPNARDPETYVPDFYLLPGQMQTFPSHSSEKRLSLRAGAHLRNPLGRHKAGGFYNRESCFRKHVYQLDFHWSRYDILQWRDKHEKRQVSKAEKEMASESSACQFNAFGTASTSLSQLANIKMNSHVILSPIDGVQGIFKFYT